MFSLTFQQIADFSGGKLLQGNPEALCSMVGSDSRHVHAGMLFVAIVGATHNGHAHVAAAAEKGAAAVLASQEVNLPQSTGIIRVEDTILGMQNLAKAYRKLWGGVVVGLTGSNGKTSTKDMTEAVLAQRFVCHKTAGNLNNHIGLPLTVLGIEKTHQCAILEMGMNHPGEIAPLAAIARPDVGIITNIGTSHIEYMGSREAIAQEKAELLRAVDACGTVILNADDDFTPRIAAACPQRVLRAGFAADADIRVVALEAMGRAELHFPDRSHISFTLPVPGKHMLGNASLAAAAGWHFGLRPEQIAQGLESAQLTGGRLQRRTIAGLHFLDDSYNANLDSMLRGLETLRSFSPEGRRVAVLGRMAELGAHSEDFHRQVGQAAAHPEIALLCTVGEDDSRHLATSAEALGQTVLRFPNHAQCADYLKNTLSPKDLILLKGSHSAAMYEVINLLSAPSVPTPL